MATIGDQADANAAALHENQEDDKPISDMATHCETHFSEGLQILEKYEEPKYAAVLRKLQTKFIDWTAYLGVFAGGSGSLDQRLKRYPQYRDLVLLVLSMLKMNLVQCTVDPDTEESEDFSDDDTDRRKDELSGIQKSVNELDRLAIYIRQSSTSPLDARVKTFGSKKVAEVSSFEIISMLAVNILYPGASETLRQHLSKSMTERYTKLLYWKYHDKKLRADHRRDGPCRHDHAQPQQTRTPSPAIGPPHQQQAVKNSVSSIIDPELRKVPTGTNFLSGTDPSNQGSHLVIPPAEVEMPAQRRVTTSTVLRSRAKFPIPPKFQEGEDSKPCSLCRKMLLKDNIEDISSWRQHVNEDLVPFTCVLSTCDESPGFATRSEWTTHMERDHGVFWTQSRRRPDDGNQKNLQLEEESISFQVPDSCPLCCLPLDERQDAGINIRKPTVVPISRASNEPPEEMSLDSMQTGSKTATSNYTKTAKAVRFDFAKQDSEPAGERVDRPITSTKATKIDNLEPSEAANAAMLNHIADHLQFLALLTPRLSTGKLTDGEVHTFSSCQPISSDRPSGRRSTLDDEFEPPERDVLDKIDEHVKLERSVTSESREMAELSSQRMTEGTRSEDPETSTPIEWNIYSLPSPAGTHDNTVIEHIQQVCALRSSLLDAALDNLTGLGLHLSYDAYDAWVRMESKLGLARTRRGINEHDVFIPLPEQEKAITREDLRVFFDGLFYSLYLQEDEVLVDYCTEQVWATQSYPDRRQPTEERFASRRRLFAMLLVHGSPSDILIFIRNEVSDLVIPISAKTLVRYLPTWTESAVAAFIQDQRQFLSQDEIATEDSNTPTREPTGRSKPTSPAIDSESHAPSPEVPASLDLIETRAQVVRPDSRNGIAIAIICSLPIEADAVSALFDNCWEDDGFSYGRYAADPNVYSIGSIGRHNVVLVHMSDMGVATTSNAALSFRTSFPNVKLALVVGVCGVVPFVPAGSDEMDEIVLGDVIISDKILQHGLGRRLPGESMRQDILIDSLSGSNEEMRRMVGKLKGVRGRKILKSKITTHLNELRKKPELGAEYPGVHHDKLFKATYLHLQQGTACEELGCHGELVPRRRLDQGIPNPSIHFGLIASGDAIIKSGEERDSISREKDVIAFESENAGIWDNLPCMVIKGACDYADSHKVTTWQRYAAAAAAACTKAFLDRRMPLPHVLNLGTEPSKTWFLVPYPRNHDFVAREAILEKLRRLSLNSAFRARLSLFGLGGIGKTQIALEYAYWFKETREDTSVFWVSAGSVQRFHESYASIAEACCIPGSDDSQTNISHLVRRWLESRAPGCWLMVIDNADDAELFSSSGGLGPYIPECSHGSFIVTTRNKRAGLCLTKGKLPVEVGTLSVDESLQFLRVQLSDVASEQLLELSSRLERLPLALVQATAFMAANSISVSQYLQILKESDENLIDLLSQDAITVGRYAGNHRGVVAAWMISFKQIQREDVFAGELLALMAFLDRQGIAVELLAHYSRDQEQVRGRLQLTQALGLLKAFSFVTTNKDQTLGMHRLVQLVTRKWIDLEGRKRHFAGQALLAVSDAYPLGIYENWALCRAYLPHVYEVLQHEGTGAIDEVLGKAKLLHNTSLYLFELGQWGEAERFQLETIRLRQEALGKDNHLTLSSLVNLASTYRHRGRWTEAEELSMYVMESFKKQLGEDHPDTLNITSNLASIYRVQGRWGEAEILEAQAMETRKKLLGEDHPDTLSSMAHLASIYRVQGRWGEAETLGLQALETRKKLLGEDHPDTLSSMAHLASIYQGQGRGEDAEILQLHVIENRKIKLGANHPDTLSSIASLVATYQSQGRWEEARILGGR